MNTNKKTKSRQKQEMKRVEHEAKREVTFSKRKKELFNKAFELCELCSAEVALILFSPHPKTFTFGHPDANDASLKETITLRHQRAGKSSMRSTGSENRFWWDNQEIENFNELDELEQYVEYMEKLRKIVQARIDEIDLSGNLANEFINDRNLLDQNNFSLWGLK
ncbi:hypothetical protein EZV62_021044 [Acer yangbiense]|uniref:MADS-box domain-containing protein n=1 Tax=Acer yangbiense TaxID=1000413 RepID=A0A5C7H5I9_9ROSI|nr:hypothetical protein EZV62_021044 [Acer yangbiense]